MIKFEDILTEVGEWITPSLETVFADIDDKVAEAANYSLLAGGKRIRPLLMYLSAEVAGVDKSEILPFAAALELIHTYSLIHDDLPAMDNDDLRRGKPTCHKVYGEDFAILAGDALLNRAYEILIRDTVEFPSHAEASLLIASLSGIDGMVGGQSIDLMSQGSRIELDTLYELQRKKTGALIKAALLTPCLIRYDEDIYATVESFAEHMGLAFQIKDDILDYEADQEKLGKSVGKDQRDNKSTFVTLLGIDEAKQKLANEIGSARADLKKLSEAGFGVDKMEETVRFMYERDF